MDGKCGAVGSMANAADGGIANLLRKKVIAKGWMLTDDGVTVPLWDAMCYIFSKNAFIRSSSHDRDPFSGHYMAVLLNVRK